MRIQLPNNARIGCIVVDEKEQRYFNFLEKAVGNKFDFLRIIKYDHANKKFISTDGKRLHIVETEIAKSENGEFFTDDRVLEYSNGILYIYDEKKLNLKYLEWENVVPNDEELTSNEKYYHLLGGKGVESSVNKYAGILIAESGYRLNVRYILDLEGFSVQVKTHIDDKHKSKPILIVGNKMKAVIMPILKGE